MPTYHVFDDDNFGLRPNEFVIDEQAHATMDADGTLYCSHMVYSFQASGAVSQW